MDLKRTELKFMIGLEEYHKLANQLALALQRDIHGTNASGSYSIHSLYFDDLYDSRVMEKADGIEYHQKFRLRTYAGGQTRLEHKTKVGNLTNKESIWVSSELETALMNRDFERLYQRLDHPMIEQMVIRMKLDDLRPILSIDYDREAYIYPEGDVRITFDKNIVTYLWEREHLFKHKVLEPRNLILEVKYTEILPEFIRKLVFFKNFQLISYSKYYMSWLASVI